VAAPVAAAYNALMSVLYDGYTESWTVPTRGRFVASLDSAAGSEGYGSADLVYEPHVTAAMLALSGPGEDRLIAQLCARAGVAYDPRMGLYKLSDFFGHASYTRSKRRGATVTTATEPDFVVATVVADAAGTSTITPYVFVEVKRSASISYGYGYCNNDGAHLRYSTQMRCYPHGCWLFANTPEAAAAFESAAWLWIGPDVYADNPRGPWGPRIPVPEDPADISTLDEDLSQARDRWAAATLTEFANWIRGIDVGEGPVKVAVDHGRHRVLTAAAASAGYAALADLVDEWAAWGPQR
jgi:hypothetical protein